MFFRYLILFLTLVYFINATGEVCPPFTVPSRENALAAKKEAARALRQSGYKVVSSILKNQIRKYSGLGKPDGRVRDIFMITILD